MKQDKHIVDRYLQSLEGMQEAEPSAQFYASLRARMERLTPAAPQSLPFRLSWAIGVLALLLVLNGLFLQGNKTNSSSAENNQPDLMEFVNTYNQSMPSSY